MYKVLLNFSCNKFNGKVGQVFSESDLSDIKDFVPQLVKEKIIEEIPKKEIKTEEVVPFFREEVKSETPKETKKKNKGG